MYRIVHTRKLIEFFIANFNFKITNPKLQNFKKEEFCGNCRSVLVLTVSIQKINCENLLLVPSFQILHGQFLEKRLEEIYHDHFVKRAPNARCAHRTNQSAHSCAHVASSVTHNEYCTLSIMHSFKLRAYSLSARVTLYPQQMHTEMAVTIIHKQSSLHQKLELEINNKIDSIDQEFVNSQTIFFFFGKCS